MMFGVMNWPDEPMAQPMVGKGGGEPIDPQVIDHGPNRHGRGDRDQCDEMQR